MASDANTLPQEPQGTAAPLDRVVTRRDLLALIDRLARTRDLFGPCAHAEPDCRPPVRYFYERVKSAEQLALDFDYCVYGPKSLLLPPREPLFRFERSNGRFVATPRFDTGPKALVGVHPCDLHAIRLLDAVFAQHSRDEHYDARRAALFVVGVDCPAPCAPGVFCHDMGADHAESGYDVMLYPLGDAQRGRRPRCAARASGGDSRPVDRYGVVFGSDAGRAWFDEAPSLSTAASEAQQRAFRRYLRRKRESFPSALGMPRAQAAAVAERSYRSPVWESEAQRCYSCGSCNLVCPTCYCFDIQDENDLPVDTGVRERCWDACMLRDFALVAGNHNFRPQAAQRLRHRVLRKMAWIESRTGLAGCVGCGRCDRACTARISIVEIMKRLAQEGEHVHR